jgi:hypothetical protein
MVEPTSKNRCDTKSINHNTASIQSRADQPSIRPLAVDPNQAATLLSSTYSSLEKDRATGHMGVPYVKAGRRVIYRLADLDEWLKANQITPRKSTSSDVSKVAAGGL